MANTPKILLVDDDPTWTAELGDILRSANYTVDIVQSFNLARDRLLTTTYAVIIIDLKLEEGGSSESFEGLGLLSGLQFLEEISQEQGRAIVLSAYGSIEHIRLAFKRGAYDFVQKQEFDRDAFLDIVQEAAEPWESRHGAISPRELTPEEKETYRKMTLQFLRGRPVRFEVPKDAVNPWAKQS